MACVADLRLSLQQSGYREGRAKPPRELKYSPSSRISSLGKHCARQVKTSRYPEGQMLEPQFHDSGAGAAFVLWGLSDGFDVRMLLQKLAQSFA
jgi:hypothetical protein